MHPNKIELNLQQVYDDLHSVQRTIDKHKLNRNQKNKQNTNQLKDAHVSAQRQHQLKNQNVTRPQLYKCHHQMQPCGHQIPPQTLHFQQVRSNGHSEDDTIIKNILQFRTDIHQCQSPKPIASSSQQEQAINERILQQLRLRKDVYDIIRQNLQQGSIQGWHRMLDRHILMRWMLMGMVLGVELLDGVPISFKMDGVVTYFSSTGTVPVPGYKLSIGYDKHSWIGVKFMTQTSQSNLDVLVVQRANTSSSGFYKCTLQQYYAPSAQPNRLTLDSHSSLDLQAVSYSSSNSYTLHLYRTTADTQGQDWEGGQFVEICFFTSDATFDLNSWTSQYQSCYGYDVNNYQSVLVGRYIADMQLEGHNSQLYGGIDGPYPSIILFWLVNHTLTNNYDILIRIGNTINENVGYDYQKCTGTNQGDYWGKSISSLNQDLDYSGYNDGTCTLNSSPTKTKITFQRLAYTHDEFDQQITKKITICVIGQHQSCTIIQLQNIYPIMTVQSAVTIWQARIIPVLLIGVIMLCLIL